MQTRPETPTESLYQSGSELYPLSSQRMYDNQKSNVIGQS